MSMKPSWGRMLLLTLVGLALVAVAGSGLVSPSWSQGARVEYRYLLFAPSYARDEQNLNLMAREGWELAGVTHQGFIMKR